MIHYPIQIRNGPLVRQWCMRFEAKHHYFKRLAQGMTNFKNLAKSLAIKHQRLQCLWLGDEDAYLKPVTETGPGSTVELKDLRAETRDSLCNQCDYLTPETKVFMATWVVIHGVKYQKRAAVVHQHSILPAFLRIEDIFIMANGDTFFACKKRHTLLYCKHLHSYEIASMNNIVTINYDELLDYHPLDIYQVKIGDITRKYIRMRYDLADCEN